MREENPTEKKTRTSKFADQNQPPKTTRNVKPSAGGVANGSSSRLRSASTWGSNIVKGLSGGDRRNNKLQPPPTSKKVHPHAHASSGTQDLFQEIENLRGLLRESKQRELKVQAELLECKRSQSELQKEVEEKKCEVEEVVRKLQVVELEKRSHSDLVSSSWFSTGDGKPHGLEMELLELRRVNKELQLQKRDLVCRVASMESQLGTHGKASESNVIAKIKEEASLLRHTNEDLCKQVEGLQLSRLNEVEELAYLRWVNACLRNELSRNSEDSSTVESNVSREEFFSCNSSQRLNAIKKLKKWPVTDEDISSLDGKSGRRHSTSGLGYSDDEQVVVGLNDRRQSDGYMGFKELDKETARSSSFNSEVTTTSTPKSNYLSASSENSFSRFSASKEVEKRALRTPNPPPRPSCCISDGCKEVSPSQAMAPLPPPPPPPPPPMRMAAGSGTSSGVVKRAPQVVELYHSLMKRDLRKDSASNAICDAASVATVRSTMIDEIENRSTHLLAIKADVETQGDFVRSLIREVNNAVYTDIEDVVAFVKWLDDELCFLVDERAVLKHFEWPEKKADTLREAAFGYQDLKKLESEITCYADDPRTPCDLALKKMVFSSEKMERTIYNLLRTRESLMHNCKEFKIPTSWMLDNGIISKVKVGSVKLAKMYMNRVAAELQSKASSLEKDPAMDYMLLQGVRFAFRIHQFAGGFDADTMQAFEELRKLAHVLNKDNRECRDV